MVLSIKRTSGLIVIVIQMSQNQYITKCLYIHPGRGLPTVGCMGVYVFQQLHAHSSISVFITQYENQCTKAYNYFLTKSVRRLEVTGEKTSATAAM